MLINSHVLDGFLCDDIPIFPSDDISHVNMILMFTSVMIYLIYSQVMIYLIDHVLPDGYYAHNLRALSVDMAVFRDLLRVTFPKLSKHLDHLQSAAQDNTTGVYQRYGEDSTVFAGACIKSMCYIGRCLCYDCRCLFYRHVLYLQELVL